MSAPSGPISGAPTAPGLQEQLRRLVAELRAVQDQRTRESGYRGLVRRAHQAQMPTTDFQQALLAGGMKASHASELATIQKHPVTAEAFTRPSAPVSFRVALRTARGQVVAKAEKSPADVAAEQARKANENLVRLGNQLVSRQPAGQPWSIHCGLFTLSFTPEISPALRPPNPLEKTPPAETDATAPDPAAPKLVIPLSPESADKLAKLARRSGLNKAETAGLLLARAPFAQLTELVRPMDATPTLPDLEVAFGLLRGNSADPFGLPCGKTNDAIGLQQRQHPTRTPADEWRVPVAVPKTVSDAVRDIADCCGLTPGETANRLLEPDPHESFSAIAPALCHAARRRAEQVFQDKLHALSLTRRAQPDDQRIC